MRFITRAIFLLAMVALSVVSMWTTYASLNDSILPEPKVPITLPNGYLWQCSIFALVLSVAIGMMLLALKMAIVDGHKRLNILGVLGLLVVGSISITFNMDILYRVAKKDFYLSYSYNQMRGQYDEYLAKAQAELQGRRTEALKVVAKQAGELEAEVKGLRQAPAGYGTRARQEDYRLTVAEKTSQVEVQTVDEALKAVERADALLATAQPDSIEGINNLQNEIRVAAKDVGAVANMPLPPPVNLESPLFAVMSNLFQWDKIGPFEIFIVLIALLLDLGDILGYVLVPNKSAEKPVRRYLRPMPDFGTPERIPTPAVEPLEAAPKPSLPKPEEAAAALPEGVDAEAARRRSMRFLRRR